MRAILRGMLTAALVVVCAASAQATLIQVGTGGTTNPTGSSGTLVTDTISVTLNQSAFAAVGLWDSTSGTVGGGSVSGDLWYAFSATPLDQEGDTNLPSGSTLGVTAPSNSFGGGETLRGSSVVDCLGGAWGAYAQSYTMGSPGNGGSPIDISPRYDLSPRRMATWLVHVVYANGIDDSISVSPALYDNGSSTATTTLTNSTSGDLSFNGFQFASGMASGNANRWTFSNVAFATTSAEALAGITIPEPTSMIMLGTALLGLIAYAWRKRK